MWKPRTWDCGKSRITPVDGLESVIFTPSMGGGPWSRVMVLLLLSFPLQLLVSCPSPPGTWPWARRDNFEVGSKRSRVVYRIWAHVNIPPLKQRSRLMEQEEGEKKTKQKVTYLILH